MKNSIIGILVLIALSILPACAIPQTAPGGGDVSPGPFNITGLVSNGGAPLAGVGITLTGETTVSVTTAADGSYGFSGVVNRRYTLVPSLAGYAFSPNASVVTVNGADATSSYTATAATTVHPITGRIRLGDFGLSGVKIALSGDATGSVLSGTNGVYQFTGLSDGVYELTASAPGFVLSPASIVVTGAIGFENDATGSATIGETSVTAIMWGATDVAALFKVPNPPDLVGTIRAKRQNEIGAGQLALFNTMWQAGGTVTVTINCALGPQQIDFQLGAYPEITALASPGFTFYPALGSVNASQISFGFDFAITGLQ